MIQSSRLSEGVIAALFSSLDQRKLTSFQKISTLCFKQAERPFSAALQNRRPAVPGLDEANGSVGSYD
jgi:hypothetical protein